jgi:ankyrin repeat protein
MHAAGCGDEEMFDTLVQHGAKVNVAFEDGRTPLFFAATHGHHHLGSSLGLSLSLSLLPRSARNESI